MRRVQARQPAVWSRSRCWRPLCLTRQVLPVRAFFKESGSMSPYLSTGRKVTSKPCPRSHLSGEKDARVFGATGYGVISGAFAGQRHGLDYMVVSLGGAAREHQPARRASSGGTNFSATSRLKRAPPCQPNGCWTGWRRIPRIHPSPFALPDGAALWRCGRNICARRALYRPVFHPRHTRPRPQRKHCPRHRLFQPRTKAPCKRGNRRSGRSCSVREFIHTPPVASPESPRNPRPSRLPPQLPGQCPP